MPPDVFPPDTPDLLTALRTATTASHEALDASFGALDLSSRAGYARFLRAHALGLAPLFGAFRDTIERELALPCPDYPALLAADLAALGDPRIEPAPPLPLLAEAGAGLGVAYVVCGSRLGLSVLRQRGTWGETNGIATAYITDPHGHAAWKALVPRLRRTDATTPESGTARAAALSSFDSFARAFAVSAASDTVPQGADG